MKNNLLPIAKEGWKYIGYALGFFILFSVFGFRVLTTCSVRSRFYSFYLYLETQRELPSFDSSSVLCPVDGEVIAIDEITDSEYAYKVTVNTSYKDVGVLRAPMNSTLVAVEKKNGTRLSLDNPVAKQTNENVGVVFKDSNENKVKVLHTLKQSLCGVVVDVEENKNIVQSARYGLMVNGVTQIYLPKNFRLNLIMGEETRASESLVGYFS